MMNTTVVENRALRRQPIHWPVTVTYSLADGKASMRCRTLDLSVQGTSVLCERNFFVATPVTALVHVPPVSVYLSFETFEIRARMIYTLFSSGNQCFRSGLRFDSFVRGSRESLQRAIEAHISSI